ncbi:hypothetical protein CCYA_CCYA08G2480 [Cyanidiococcus yangmingshanensis]|nr:hypothetical protein CCYA_CCYA08G2480 [Cyanidiococcus yangmingshanensis]
MQYFVKTVVYTLAALALICSCSWSFLRVEPVQGAAVRNEGAPQQQAFAGYAWLPEQLVENEQLVERAQVYVTRSTPKPKKTVKPIVTPKKKVKKVKKTVVVTSTPKVIVKPTEVVVTVTALATVTKTPTPTPVHVTVTEVATRAVTVTASAEVAAVSRTPTPLPKKVICRFWMKNCNIQEINRQICFTGENIDQFTCEQIGCCWQPIKSAKAPACYRAVWAPVCNLQCNFQAYLTNGEGVSQTPNVQATSSQKSSGDAPNHSSNATQDTTQSSGNAFASLQSELSGLPSTSR